jgi:hypothetical protein
MRVPIGRESLPQLVRLIAFGWLLIVNCTWGRAEEGPAGSGWSADLLSQILKVEPAKVEAAPLAAPSSAEMVLRTYRFTNLRVGEAGKSQNVLAILGKLLPAGSSVKTDVPANSLHLLTTPTAHTAAWEYLSAVDVAEAAPALAANTVPEEVKTALKKLADAGDQSAKVLAAVGALKTDVSTEIARIDARQRQQTTKFAIGGLVFTAVLVVTIGWMLRRRSGSAQADSPTESTAFALAPEQLTIALTPVHDKMRNDMLGLLNEVAIKLQAQHNEQQKLVREQQQQLEDARQALADERRQFITEAGSMVVQAVEKVDATTAKLAKQQDKVAELVQELQDTVRELDETKDDLRSKQVELEQERAKIAALSILLEEGGALPTSEVMSNGHATNGRLPNISTSEAPDLSGSGASRVPPPISCTNQSQILIATTPALERTTETAPQFQFLPPDHPEI